MLLLRRQPRNVRRKYCGLFFAQRGSTGLPRTGGRRGRVGISSTIALVPIVLIPDGWIEIAEFISRLGAYRL